MKNTKMAFVINILIVLFEILAISWMASGRSGGVYSFPGIYMLNFFTIDSNILMGIAALISIIEEFKVIKGKKEEVSKFSRAFKLMSVVGVTLTMLVTMIFLAPASPYGYFSLFTYSNFFLHLLNPLLSIIVFVMFEKSKSLSLKHTFIGIIPMVIYSFYYVWAAVTHSHDGIVESGYDWYGFFTFGLNSIVIVLPIMYAITYVISVVLWKLNKEKER
ncbi:MAG: hypothetical protein IKI57_07130 [Clostridia bacterium]|nr:hypothetical protein [Clostridia bacterium]